jgi:hypothetical protein
MFQSLRVVENYLGCGEAICVAFEFDVKLVIPLLLTCFDRFNPISQACATKIDVPNSQFEEGNTFGVKASMEESSHVLVGKIYLFKRLSILPSTCVDPLSWW